MKSNLKELLDERYPDVVRFRETLTPESDRGCALIAAAYLDTSVSKLLRKCLVADATVARRFMRPDGPLGTFSARIDAVYLLGKVSAATHRELHLIRKIRNDFGHNPEPINFEHPPVASRCKELQYSGRESEAAPRQHFTSSACGSLAAIHAAELATEPLPVKPDLVLDEEAKKNARSLVDQVLNVICSELPSILDEETIKRAKSRAHEMIKESIIAEQGN